MTTHRIFRLLAAIVLLAMPGLVRAQSQTGSLSFEVTDPSGKAVAGAKVAISSEKVPGQERTTDEFGKTRFLLLPPGTFKASVTAEGFNAHSEEGIDVGLGQRVTVQVKLQPVMEETMEVSAPSEATVADIDVTETKTATVLTATQLEQVQLGSGGRSYLAALGKTPGVVGGGGNPSVHGATIGENSYTIDGVNTTDPVTGTFGLLTNFDIIEQLEVNTGGFQAEYGGATGGIINQITKSGTNEFEGSLDIRRYNEKFVENSPHFTDSLPASFEKYSATLTGPVAKDKLWFALSYEQNTTERTPAGSQDVRTFDGNANLAKLTWEPTSGHRIAVQYTEDPASIDNVNAGALVDTTATSHQDQGAKFWKLNYTGQLNDNWALSVLGGWYKSSLDAFPMFDSGLPAATESNTGYSFQNYGNAQFSERTNDQYAFQVQRAWSGKYGDHVMKFGYDLQKTGLWFDSYTTAGETWDTDGCDTDGDGDIDDPTCLVDDGLGDDIPDNVNARYVAIEQGPSSNPGKNQSLYVQDTWSHRSWTLDVGLRWDASKAEDDSGATVVDVDLLQPRLGMSFDLKNDGRQKLHWSISRRMHPGILTIPNAVNTRADATSYQVNEEYYGVDFDGDGNIDDKFVEYLVYGGPSGSKVDPGLDPTYVDEVIVGYERKLKKSQRFASRLVLNETNDIIEDTEFPQGSGQYEIRNISELRREYQGIELEYGWLHKRGSLQAVATISQTRGNVEYTQGLGTDWDILPQHSVNRWGKLSTDATLRLRVYGWVDLPKKWTIGYDLAYRSGTPYNRTVAVQPYGVEFVEPRGSRRFPSLYTLDTEIRKYFTFGETDRYKLTMLGTITNLTNANAVTGVITRDGGSFGRPTAWQNTRTLELGLRFTF